MARPLASLPSSLLQNRGAYQAGWRGRCPPGSGGRLRPPRCPPGFLPAPVPAPDSCGLTHGGGIFCAFCVSLFDMPFQWRLSGLLKPCEFSRFFLITVERYECESCKYCRLKKQCTKAKGNRNIERNERWLRLKRKAKRVLEDERYIELRKQRSVEVETVFGQIKGNQGYRRFLLRGKPKVSTEWGLLVLGYNIKQIHRIETA